MEEIMAFTFNDNDGNINNIDDGEARFESRVQAWTAYICDALARSADGNRLQVRADSDDDYDLFEAVAARLFDECGVLAVHAASRSPLVFEVGPRAVDIWGPAIARTLDEAENRLQGDGALLDTHHIYEQTAKQWRNLLRLQPLSMTDYEEALMVRLAEDMALARGLAVAPIDRHRFHVHLPRACPFDAFGDDGAMEDRVVDGIDRGRDYGGAGDYDDNDNDDMLHADGGSWWRSVFVQAS